MTFYRRSLSIISQFFEFLFGESVMVGQFVEYGNADVVTQLFAGYAAASSAAMTRSLRGISSPRRAFGRNAICSYRPKECRYIARINRRDAVTPFLSSLGRKDNLRRTAELFPAIGGPKAAFRPIPFPIACRIGRLVCASMVVACRGIIRL